MITPRLKIFEARATILDRALQVMKKAETKYFAGRFTTQRPIAWAASPVTPDFSQPRMVSRVTARCCSTAESHQAETRPVGRVSPPIQNRQIQSRRTPSLPVGFLPL